MRAARWLHSLQTPFDVASREGEMKGECPIRRHGAEGKQDVGNQTRQGQRGQISLSSYNYLSQFARSHLRVACAEKRVDLLVNQMPCNTYRVNGLCCTLSYLCRVHMNVNHDDSDASFSRQRTDQIA